MFIYLIQGLFLGMAAVVQPGPFLMYLVSQTLSYGFRKTWMTAFAPLISDGPIIAVALLILTQMPGWLQQSLFAISGIFILYLAWGSFQQWRNYTSLAAKESQPGKQSLFKSALMNALSPMPYIYWSLVTGPILIAGWKQAPASGIAFILGFYLAMICGLLLVLWIFSAARNLGDKVSRALLGISTLLLAGFGIFQLWRAWMA